MLRLVKRVKYKSLHGASGQPQASKQKNIHVQVRCLCRLVRRCVVTHHGTKRSAHASEEPPSSDAAHRRAQRLPVGASGTRCRARLRQGGDLRQCAQPAHRYPPPARGWCGRTVLVRVRPVVHAGPRGRTRHARTDRHRPPDGGALAADLWPGTHGGRGRARVQEPPHRVAHRHGRWSFD